MERALKSFESIVAWLVPTVLVNGTPWATEWAAKERATFITTCRVAMPLLTAAWVFHYLLLDRPMMLEPPERWLLLRGASASACLAGFAFYLSPIAQRVNWYRVPAIIICGVISASQAYVAKWFVPGAAVFCFVFVIGATMLLRMSVLGSIGFALAVISLQALIVADPEVLSVYFASGTIVTIVIVGLIRASMLSEVQNFILSRQNVAAQRKIAELNSDFSARIRAFIPKVIADRMQSYIDKEGRTVLAASLDVLEPRKRDVACLFSDIRGFTQGSNDLDKFIRNSVIPELKACSEVVEKFGGIPRKIGDLLFAYFDEEFIRLNLVRAVAAGLDIARLNADMNATATDVNVRRYILIASGEAVVGNLGGLDSSVEITALGPPVNFLSRLDELTKHAALATLLEPGDILLCERSATLLQELKLNLHLVPLDLSALRLAVRDFPNNHKAYILRPNDHNYKNVMEPYNYIRTRERDHVSSASGGERVAAA